MPETPLIDSFGRLHDNLRISVTDRCNIRCFYCMPETDVHFVERAEILDFEEIERFVRIAVRLGITKLRLTGGEPLLRRDLPVLVSRLAAIPGIRDMALTTNGVLLPKMAQSLYDAGLRRLNVHLDTLDRERFFQITRRDEFRRINLVTYPLGRYVAPDHRRNGVIVRSRPHMAFDVVLMDREQAIAQLTIGSEAETVAVQAKRLADGCDEADRATAVRVAVFGSWRARIGIGNRMERRDLTRQRVDDVLRE